MNNKEMLLGLLLPSKGRFVDLLLTLHFVPLIPPNGLRVHYFVCANYNYIQLAILRLFFSKKATFLDERQLKWTGMTGAYNYSFNEAVKEKATWVALWADDLLPENKFWLDTLYEQISEKDFSFGIFSSDEGHHKNQFGWNVFGGYPCAHFFVAKVDSLPGYLLNPQLRAYVADNEIVISRIKHGTLITLLNIRVIHQPTMNGTRRDNTPSYHVDLMKVYELHPELIGKLDSAVLGTPDLNGNCRYIIDNGESLLFSNEFPTMCINDFKLHAPKVPLSYKYQLIRTVRKLMNEFIMFPIFSIKRVLILFCGTYKSRSSNEKK